MNTLNYKALLARQCFVIFRWAIGIYMILTLPALYEFGVYFISAVFALIFGSIVLPVFILLVSLISFFAPTSKRIPAIYFAVALSVLLAFQAIVFAYSMFDIWQSGTFLLFPLAAIVAGWIAVYRSQRKLRLIMALAGRRNHSLSTVL